MGFTGGGLFSQIQSNGSIARVSTKLTRLFIVDWPVQAGWTRQSTYVLACNAMSPVGTHNNTSCIHRPVRAVNLQRFLYGQPSLLGLLRVHTHDLRDVSGAPSSDSPDQGEPVLWQLQLPYQPLEPGAQTGQPHRSDIIPGSFLWNRSLPSSVHTFEASQEVSPERSSRTCSCFKPILPLGRMPIEKRFSELGTKSTHAFEYVNGGSRIYLAFELIVSVFIFRSRRPEISIDASKQGNPASIVLILGILYWVNRHTPSNVQIIETGGIVVVERAVNYISDGTLHMFG